MLEVVFPELAGIVSMFVSPLQKFLSKPRLIRSFSPFFSLFLSSVNVVHPCVVVIGAVTNVSVVVYRLNDGPVFLSTRTIWVRIG